jgi:hypothetical protein
MASRKILAIAESEAFSDPEGIEVKIEAVAKRGRDLTCGAFFLSN